jgi:non-ribosomal peptide synthetase component F
LVGSPIANRNSSAIEKLMGFFANTLALRGDLGGNPSFLELLERVKQTTLSAYAHQDLPFEMLVEKLQLNRDLSHNPLIQVMFSLQNTPQSEASLSGLKMENLPLSVELKARFDLEVNFWEVADRLEAVWCYSTDLFAAGTIKQMGNIFRISYLRLQIIPIGEFLSYRC